MRKALFLTLFTVGCSSSPLSESVSELEQRAGSVNDCCEIDGGDVGTEDHLVRLGSRVVLVHDWIKTNGVYTGFSMTVSDGKSMSYLVKLDSQTLSGTQAGFQSDGRGITRVNFCGECDSPDGCEDGGGGDGPGGGDGGGGYDEGGDGGDGDGGGDGGGDDGECGGGDGCPGDYGGTSGGPLT